MQHKGQQRYQAQEYNGETEKWVDHLHLQKAVPRCINSNTVNQEQPSQPLKQKSETNRAEIHTHTHMKLVDTEEQYSCEFVYIDIQS